jgi:hypothetical protein
MATNTYKSAPPTGAIATAIVAGRCPGCRGRILPGHVVVATAAGVPYCIFCATATTTGG